MLKLEVINSPFSEEQVKLLNELIPQLTAQQKVWLSGYLNASQAFEASATKLVTSEQVATTVSSQVSAPAPSATKTITILYGSQTGNSQSIAEKFGKLLKEQQFKTTVSSMSDFKTNTLKKVDHLFIIVSTNGEGDPPDNAISFYDFLKGKRAPKLDHVKYSVLSLGDSSYEFFCQTGKDFDGALANLGATSIVPRQDCDLDYDEDVSKWFAAVQKEILETSTVVAPVATVDSSIVVGESQYSRKNPFYAEVLEKVNLNGLGSNKETIHLELSLEGSGLEFEPGDSLGIFPNNDSSLVSALITALGFDANTQVSIGEEQFSLQEALEKHLEFTALSKALLKKITPFTTNEAFHKLLENDAEAKQYVYGRDLLDVVESFGPFSWDAQSFVGLLRKLPVRQYSIASSLKAYPEEVHLTIGSVRFEIDGRKRNGVCSVEIAERVEIGDKIPVYVHSNKNFRLPENPETPIIMIGAGTGIAPYRSFLQEREEDGAEGKAWLFFGDQHFVTDFLYQTEMQAWLKDGTLNNFNVAFSRDTEEKVYVQHRMQQNAKELYEWIEAGAHIYVCGDKDKMAADVQKTLIAILSEQGKKSEEEAQQFLSDLQKQKRYQRDIY